MSLSHLSGYLSQRQFLGLQELLHQTFSIDHEQLPRHWPVIDLDGLSSHQNFLLQHTHLLVKGKVLTFLVRMIQHCTLAILQKQLYPSLVRIELLL